MATSFCPHCGTRVSPQQNFCNHCGYPLAAQQAVHCPRCHALVSDELDFCNHCGFDLAANGSTASMPPMDPPPTTQQSARGDRNTFGCVVIIVGLVIMGLIGALNGGELQSDPQPSRQAAAIAQPSRTAQPTGTPRPTPAQPPTPVLPTPTRKPLTPVEQLELSVRTSGGSFTNDVNVQEVEPGTIRVTFPLSSSWNEEMTRKSGYMAMTDMAQAAYSSSYPLEYLTMEATTELIDAYGNTSDDMVLKVSLSKETAGRINWGQFSYNNLPTIADDVYIHPALNR